MSVDRVLAALADPTRRQLLEALSRRPGCSATTLAAHVPVSRQAVAKHLAVLRESRLVTRHRAGKEVLLGVCPAELAEAASRARPARAHQPEHTNPEQDPIQRKELTLDHERFPNESAQYRAARDALKQAELELTQQLEEVAALRRALPLGGAVPEDYVFTEGPAD